MSVSINVPSSASFLSLSACPATAGLAVSASASAEGGEGEAPKHRKCEKVGRPVDRFCGPLPIITCSSVVSCRVVSCRVVSCGVVSCEQQRRVHAVSGTDRLRILRVGVGRDQHADGLRHEAAALHSRHARVAAHCVRPLHHVLGSGAGQSYVPKLGETTSMK